MDGAFIAYHNTKEIFGFEYVKTKEIEARIFGIIFMLILVKLLIKKVLENSKMKF